MRLTNRFALRLPRLTSLRDGLVRTSLILTPHGYTYALREAVRLFDEPLFSSVREWDELPRPDLPLTVGLMVATCIPASNVPDETVGLRSSPARACRPTGRPSASA